MMSVKVRINATMSWARQGIVAVEKKEVLYIPCVYIVGTVMNFRAP
jgi:hypothetical protein